MTVSSPVRHAALILLCLLTLTVSAGVQGQAPWAVYLLDSGAQALLRVHSDGTQAVLPLGLNPGEYVSAFDIGLSPDGSKAALCPVQYGDGTTTPTAALVVRDLASQTTVLRQELGPALGCRATYRSDGAFVALGMVHYLPGAAPPADGLPVWELRVVEPAAGGTIASLRSDGPEAAAAGLSPSDPILPLVRRFEGAEVILAALPYTTGETGPVPGLSWRVDAAALTPIEPWGNLQLDTLSNGEFAWAAADPARPAGQPPGPMPAYNVVRLRDATGQTRTIFASPDWLLMGVRFIDDGQRLALHLAAPFTAESSTPSGWVAVDRSGAVQELTSAAGYAQVQSAPGGHVVLQSFAPQDGGAPTYTLDYVAGGQISTLWAAPSTSSAYELVWSPPVTPAAGLAPFPAIP